MTSDQITTAMGALSGACTAALTYLFTATHVEQYATLKLTLGGIAFVAKWVQGYYTQGKPPGPKEGGTDA